MSVNDDLSAHMDCRTEATTASAYDCMYTEFFPNVSNKKRKRVAQTMMCRWDIFSFVRKIRLHGRRGKGTKEVFFAIKPKASTAEGRWKIRKYNVTTVCDAGRLVRCVQNCTAR